MLRPARNHPAYWAFLAHRISGVALALFLPLHFLALGLAIEGAAALDRFLAIADLPLVKAAEWGLVMLLTVHAGAGIRLLMLELLPWRHSLKGLIALAFASAIAAGALFLARVV